MSDKTYEDMTDRELEELTEETLREQESGEVRFQRRDPAAAKVEGTVPISIRVPVTLLTSIKAAAATRGIPYQRLMKIWLEEGLAHDNPNVVPKAVTLRLTEYQLTRLRQSGSLDIHLEGS
jgi:predicted DNA binding CopG/RHH family protein